MKLFLMRNKILLGVIGVCFLISCYLLFAVITVHTEMSQSSEKVLDTKNRNTALKNRKTSAHVGNKEIFDADIKMYNEKLNEFRYYFGHPFYDAVDAFAKELGVEGGYPAFIDLYRKHEEKKSGGNHTKDYVYLDFKNQFIENNRWNKALAVFIEKAQPFTVEPLNMNNADAILGSELGVPRNMVSEVCLNYLIAMKSKTENIFKSDRKKVLGDSNFGFTFSNLGMPPASEIPDIIKCFEIITDLVKRIGKANIKSLDLFERRDIIPSGEGNFKRYRFRVTVTADMDGLRDLIRVLDDAYNERRVYIVKTMDIVAVTDEAQSVAATFSKNEGVASRFLKSSSGIGNSGRPNRITRTASKTDVVVDADKPFYERMGYGSPAVGASTNYKAVIDIDYVVYVTDKQDE